MSWPEDNGDRLERDVDAALAQLWSSAQGEADDQGAKRRRMARLVYALGIPAGTLAAVAGSTAVAHVPAWITAVIALLSALLSAAMGVIGPVQGRMDHGTKEAEFAHFAWVVWTTRLRLEGRAREEQLGALTQLVEQRYRLDLQAPVRQIASDERHS